MAHGALLLLFVDFAVLSSACYVQVRRFALRGCRRQKDAVSASWGRLELEVTSTWIRLPRRKGMFGKVRKTRSDCTVGTYEKKHDLPTGTLRNSDGRKARKDKTLKSLRKETGSDYR